MLKEFRMSALFDTSTFFDFEELDRKVSPDQLLSILMNNFENISRARFPSDPIKQKIHKHSKRITGSCPYCGDSMQSSWKQRGNIILEGKHKFYYKCFNCGEFKRVDQFFKDFKIDLTLDVLTYIAENKGDFTSVAGKYDISLLLDVPTIEGYAIDRQEIKKRFGLIEAKDSPVWSWLNRRLQFKEEYFLYSTYHNFLLILNLTPSGKILGFQKRRFLRNHGGYMTYGATKMYELLGKTEQVPDEIETLSQLFNICRINFNRPVTIFEGPLDSFLFPNSIANGGANKSFPIEMPRRYFYDDDATGRSNALKRINEGYQIFLWDRLKRDYGLPPKPAFGRKWDLNDFMIWLKMNKAVVPMWDKYFTDDPMDLIEL